MLLKRICFKVAFVLAKLVSVSNNVVNVRMWGTHHLFGDRACLGQISFLATELHGGDRITKVSAFGVGK